MRGDDGEREGGTSSRANTRLRLLETCPTISEEIEGSYLPQLHVRKAREASKGKKGEEGEDENRFFIRCRLEWRPIHRQFRLRLALYLKNHRHEIFE
jgi:hypothetical protein